MIDIRTERIRENAARGAQFFDALRPGWHDQIDLGRLNLHNPFNCIFGQLYGSYDRGITVTSMETVEEREAHGVTFAAHGGLTGYPDRYATLREAWVAEITQRRSA
jgi:hypothetical protein